MNYFPPEPTADNVLMETWEVWTTKNNYRSLWRVTTYESGWMDWWLSSVCALYALHLFKYYFQPWLCGLVLFFSTGVKQLRCHVRTRALGWNCLDAFRWETVRRLQREFGAYD